MKPSLEGFWHGFISAIGSHQFFFILQATSRKALIVLISFLIMALDDIGLNSLVGMNHVTELLYDLDKFKNFLKDFHNKKMDSDVFRGYLFLIKTVQRCILESSLYLDFLDFEKDLTWEFAISYTTIDKVTSTCEMARFFRNLYLIFRKCWKSKDESELKGSINNARSVISLINNIFTNDLVVSGENIKLEELVKRVTMEIVFVYLNDLQRGTPNGYSCHLLDNDIPGNINDNFEGYKLGLQYLWFVLLGDDFSKSCVFKMYESKNWSELDFYFGLLQDELIDSLRAKAKKSFLSEDLFLLHTTPRTSLFSSFLVDTKLPKLSKKEALEEQLWWQRVTTSYPSGIFTQTASFAITLTGLLNLGFLGPKGKLPVIRFRHTESKEHNHNRYSYAVYLGSKIGWYNPSGWVLFVDCGTDFSGRVGYEYAQAESVIKENEKKILLKEIVIGMDELLEILGITSWFEKEKLTKKIGDLNSILIYDTGLLLESLAYAYLQRKGYIIKHWRFPIDDKEIDLVVEKDGITYLVECQNTMHRNEEKVREFIDEIKNKLDYLGEVDKGVILFSSTEYELFYIENRLKEHLGELKVISVSSKDLIRTLPIQGKEANYLLNRLVGQFP